MQEKESIEQLFKEAFSNYEEPVRPELWSKISSAIQTTPPVADPASVVNSTITSGSGIFGSAAIWIAGAALIVLTGAGVYFFSSESTGEIPVNEQIIPQAITTPGASERVDQQSQMLQNKLPENINSEKNTTSESVTENHPAIEKAPSTEAHSSQKESTETVASITINHKSTPTPVNQHTTIQEPVQQSNQNVIDEPNISPEQAKEEAASHFLVSPLNGPAPLTVDFIYSGDAERTEWQFGDGYGDSQLSGTHHTFEKPGEYNVTLKVYDDAGTLITLNKIIKVQPGLQIKYVPNIFTPNNDGLNDVFTFDAPNIAELEVLIYDHSGKFVYKWTGLEGGWDGKLNSGDVVPDGTYFYIIFATGENGQKHQQKGIISVDRFR